MRFAKRRYVPGVEAVESRASLSSLGNPTGARPLSQLARAETGLQVSRNLTFATAGSRPLTLDVYRSLSPSTAPLPVILAIHGGGWRRFSKDDYGPAASVFARSGYVVVAINYRLSSPRSPSWPGVFDDVRASVRWLKANAAAFGADPDRIVAMGESAGGHLAALLGTDQTAEPGGLATASVQAVVDFYGPTDLTRLDAISPTGRSAVRQLLGGSPSALPIAARQAAPIGRVTQATAPMFIVQGTRDTTVPLEQSLALADALKSAGVPYRLEIIPGATHGFRFQVGRRNLIPEILSFLDQVWSRRKAQALGEAEVEPGADPR